MEIAILSFGCIWLFLGRNQTPIDKMVEQLVKDHFIYQAKFEELVSVYGKLNKPLPFPLKSKSVILLFFKKQWLHKNAMSMVKKGASWHPT
jgi:hypothetical protein